MPDISPAIAKALNDHAHVELGASTLYLAASFHLKDLNYDGIAKFLVNESNEERGHAMKIFDYVQSRNGKVSVPSTPVTIPEWETLVEVFESLLEAEKDVSTRIHALCDAALEAKDHATRQFLDFFLLHQVTAEDEMSVILAKVKSYSAMPGLMWHLNAEL